MIRNLIGLSIVLLVAAATHGLAVLAGALPPETLGYQIGLLAVALALLAAGLVARRRASAQDLKNAHAQISASIDYASNIQRAILPEDGLMSETLGEHFVIWQPKDVVGGDYYWIREWGDGRLLALGDCTGHGVPGAFMTLIATATLNWSLRVTPPGDLGQLMSCINGRIQGVLKKGDGVTMADDGVDLALFYMPNGGKTVHFCGTGMSLFLARGMDVSEVKGSRMGIGFQSVPADRAYPATELDRDATDRFYLASDGVFDQTGGPQGHGFGKRRFKDALVACVDKSTSEQKIFLNEVLTAYQGEHPRRDDVTIIGFGLPAR